MDLAWGTKARTGLAVLDGTGRLLDVTAARTDEEILSWCQSWIRASCLVAIDAPIVVPNDDGRRYCETLVSRYFGAYNAGAHSSNRSLPSFRDGSRGLRLARALGLEVDPASAAARRAIEVYPHPAIVMLFGLPAVLQYKARPGRSLETRRAELLRLVGYLDGLAAADPPLSTVEAGAWAQVRRAVEGATRPVDLERVEDVVDAVVCAYIALYASVRPGDVRVLGDVERGYILTPVDATDGSAPRRQQQDCCGKARTRGRTPATRRSPTDRRGRSPRRRRLRRRAQLRGHSSPRRRAISGRGSGSLLGYGPFRARTRDCSPSAELTFTVPCCVERQ